MTSQAKERARELAEKFCGSSHNSIMVEREHGGGCYNCRYLRKDITSALLSTRNEALDSALEAIEKTPTRFLNDSNQEWAYNDKETKAIISNNIRSLKSESKRGEA